ncbi:hypothetical protein F4803DRAFT_519599 [Xylaria telfairii]|nr:hypothetical protein F4803DRAFT_519599 [Xylaria telfairii]
MLTELSIPTSCLTETWVISASGTNPVRAILGNSADPKCWPGTRNLGTIISPAICPSGYTSACDIDPQSRGDASETLWACCPSNFVCDGGFFSCIRHLNDNAPRTYFLTDTNSLGETTTTPVVTDGVNAHSVRVAFHSSDLADLFPSTTDLPPPNATAAPTAISSLSTSTSSATGGATDSKSLPAGGLVGIGVASALGAVLLLSGAFWLVRRRHRNKQDSSSKSPKKLFSMPRPLELSAVRNIHELDSETPNNANNTNNIFTVGPQRT